MNEIDMPTAISMVSAVAAIASAIYAFLQVKEARKSASKAEEAVKEAFTQNKINSIIILKEHLEKELPNIRKMADHFAGPHTQKERREIDAEHEQKRKKLQRVSEEIEKFYELYVPPRR